MREEIRCSRFASCSIQNAKVELCRANEVNEASGEGIRNFVAESHVAAMRFLIRMFMAFSRMIL
jgi:hypothetical protein